MRKGLVIAGAVTFGSTYLISTGVASAFQDGKNNDAMVPLFVPVLGPFITVGTANPSAIGTFALVVDGLAQSAGVAMFVAGIAAPEKIWVLDNVAIGVTPRVGPSQAGAAVTLQY